jgi:phosphoribosyl-ATP pyrophosphohydrolase
MKEIIEQLKYDEKGLIPAITQDYKTDEILMMAYMNKESLEKTIETGKAHYYSRSRQKLWLKGETSGHFQNVKSISIDCDADTLLLKVEQIGVACHTGHRSCFFRKLEVDTDKTGNEEKQEFQLNIEKTEITQGTDLSNENHIAGPEVLKAVYNVIMDRVVHPKEGSYTNYLIEKGMDKILKKVGEETTEVVIAAKNGVPAEIKLEVADLLYHIMVMLVKQGMTLEDVYEELDKRR